MEAPGQPLKAGAGFHGSGYAAIESNNPESNNPVNTPLGFIIQQQPNQLMSFLPMVLIMVVFYFLLFLPMQRQKKQQKAMIESLKNGDSVVTSGGIVGTVYRINNEDDTLVLQVKPDNIKLQVSRASVTATSSTAVAGEKKS